MRPNKYMQVLQYPSIHQLEVYVLLQRTVFRQENPRKQFQIYNIYLGQRNY